MTLPSSIRFEDTAIAIHDRDGTPWLAAADLARALGYTESRKVTQLYDRNAEEFDDSMTVVLKMSTKGFGSGDSEKPVRIFSPRGAHLIAMLARTPRAKSFRRFVLDVLDRMAAPPAASWTAIDLDAIDPMGMARFLVDHETQPRLPSRSAARHDGANTYVPHPNRAGHGARIAGKPYWPRLLERRPRLTVCGQHIRSWAGPDGALWFDLDGICRMHGPDAARLAPHLRITSGNLSFIGGFAPGAIHPLQRDQPAGQTLFRLDAALLLVLAADHPYGPVIAQALQDAAAGKGGAS